MYVSNQISRQNGLLGWFYSSQLELLKRRDFIQASERLRSPQEGDSNQPGRALLSGYLVSRLYPVTFEVCQCDAGSRLRSSGIEVSRLKLVVSLSRIVNSLFRKRVVLLCHLLPALSVEFCLSSQSELFKVCPVMRLIRPLLRVRPSSRPHSGRIMLYVGRCEL